MSISCLLFTYANPKLIDDCPGAKLSLPQAGMTEATATTLTLFKFIHDIESYLNNRHKYQLRNSIARRYQKALLSAVPAGNKNLPLIIRIY